MGPHSDERTSLPVSKPGLKIQESCILDWIPAFRNDGSGKGRVVVGRSAALRRVQGQAVLHCRPLNHLPAAEDGREPSRP